MNKREITENHQHYIIWLDTLLSIPEATANASYLEGKWSPNEILMHLAEWDRFTHEQRLSNMTEGAELERFPEFEAFNAEAAGLAREQTFKETIAYAREQRQKITKELERIEEDNWLKAFKIGDHVLTLEKYFTDFAQHDAHHKKQIELARCT